MSKSLEEMALLFVQMCGQYHPDLCVEPPRLSGCPSCGMPFPRMRIDLLVISAKSGSNILLVKRAGLCSNSAKLSHQISETLEKGE